MPILALLLALAAPGLPAATVPAQDGAPAAAQDRAAGTAPRAGDAGAEKAPARAPDRPLASESEWQAIVARERRLGFTARTPTDARAELDKQGLPPERRAVAWLALGAAGSLSDKKRLEELARDGEGAEREAAVLALGELGAGADDVLVELAGSADRDVAECALLALLRSQRPSARRRVEEAASDPSDPLSARASELVVFDADPASSRPTRATQLLLELRWEAARRFGLVDGQSWSVLRTTELARDVEFVSEVAIRAAPRLRRPGVKDHLLVELLEGSGPARLRAAILAMPLEVHELVSNGLWRPKDQAEWTVLLDQIGARALESLSIDLLELASQEEPLSLRALAMLARTGRVDLAGRLDVDLARAAPEARWWGFEAVGSSGDLGWLKRLAPLREHAEPSVRAGALVAMTRLGSRKAEAELREAAADELAPDHAEIVEALCRVARDPIATAVLEEHLEAAKGDEAVEIARALTSEGRLTARSKVREALGADPPPKGQRALDLVRALRRNATPEDLGVLQSLFPQEGERELNLELALSLIELGDPECLPLLRSALWRARFDVSLIAGGLLADISGQRALRGELARPPRFATSADLRRVGYAIGTWGGLVEVEGLARELRYNSGDPALQGAMLGFLGTRTH